MRRGLFIAASLVLCLAAPDADAGDQHISPLSEAEIDAARERMLQAITIAQEDGAIRLRKDADTTGLNDEVATVSSKEQITTMQPIRSCPDKAAYLTEAEDTYPDTQARIDTLRSVMTTPDAPGKAEASEALAREYLAIGFFAEARAIAASGHETDDELALVLSLSHLGLGNLNDAATGLAQFVGCGPSIEALHFSAALEENEAASYAQLAKISAGALSRVTPKVAALAAERIALFALDHDERDRAIAFYAVALAARGAEKSPALTILADALGGEAGISPVAQHELADIAMNDAAMQERAIMAIVRDAGADSLPYDRFIDDLAGADPGANEKAAIDGARFLVSVDRLDDAITLLRKNKKNGGVTEGAIGEARELIRTAMQSDMTSHRLNAIEAYISNIDILANAGLTEVIAIELAKWDAMALLDKIVAATPELSPQMAAQLKQLNSERVTHKAAQQRIAPEGSMSHSVQFVSDEATSNSVGRPPLPVNRSAWPAARALHQSIEDEIALISGSLANE